MSSKDILNLKDLLRLQLAELEMLTSMYPNDEEFHLDDPSVVTDITNFIENSGDLEAPPRLDFTMFLKIDEKKLEVNCSLPHDYPTVDPEVYVRSPYLTRVQQHNLNADLAQFLSEGPRGELCVGTLIQWLSDNAGAYIAAGDRCRPSDDQVSEDEHNEDDGLFTRLWIYSHHIYNKCKRRSILEIGHDLRLSGFCLPGKPGIICVEGPSRDCNSFWQQVRHMNWKKIMLKKKEGFNLASDEGLRKFPEFQEVSFKTRSGLGREYHMDMGEFFMFLEQHNCGYVFKDYFGVDGKIASHNAHNSNPK